MAIFQPPPVPPVFTGGAQPYSQRKNPVQVLLPVNNPPFGLPEAVAIAAEIIATSQPNPWVYAYFGAWQPYTPRQLPGKLIGIAVDNPPFGLPEAQAIAAEIIATAQPDPWTYAFFGAQQPYTARLLNPSITAVRVDNPPFGWPVAIALGASIVSPPVQPDPWVYAFFGAWQPYAPKQANPNIIRVPSDLPPFALGGPFAELIEAAALAQPDAWTYNFTGGRQPFEPRKLSPGVPGQSVDQPPTVLDGPTALKSETVSLWQPDPWRGDFQGARQPYAPRWLNPSITAVPVNNPPFTRGGPVAIKADLVTRWQPDPWPATFEGGREAYEARRLPPVRGILIQMSRYYAYVIL